MRLIKNGIVILITILTCVVVTAHADATSSAHFKLQEFACKCCGVVKVNSVLLTKLEMLRVKLNAPIIITSGYRCPKHNKVIGGARYSQHCLGNAVDIKVKGYTPIQVARMARQVGFTWVKTYRSWTHVDIR